MKQKRKHEEVKNPPIKMKRERKGLIAKTTNAMMETDVHVSPEDVKAYYAFLESNTALDKVISLLDAVHLASLEDAFLLIERELGFPCYLQQTLPKEPSVDDCIVHLLQCPKGKEYFLNGKSETAKILRPICDIIQKLSSVDQIGLERHWFCRCLLDKNDLKELNSSNWEPVLGQLLKLQILLVRKVYSIKGFI
jgi:hypothetical protein